jgi:hypothetical protein
MPPTSFPEFCVSVDAPCANAIKLEGTRPLSKQSTMADPRKSESIFDSSKMGER